MNRVRVGVVGLGAIAQTVHLPLLRRRWDLFEVSAVADLSAERRDAVGSAWGVPSKARFADLAGVCDAGLVDAVVLLTAGDHAPQVIDILGHGLPVLCEKPLGLTRAGAQAVVDAEAEAGRPMVLVGYMKEYDAAVVGARSALAARAGAPTRPGLPAPAGGPGSDSVPTPDGDGPTPGHDLRMVDVEVLHPADGSQLAFANLLPPPGDIPGLVLERLAADREEALDCALGAGSDTALRALYANVVLGSVIHDVSLLRHLAGGIADVRDARHRAAPDGPGSLELTGALAGGVPFHLGWHFIARYPAYRERVTVHHGAGSVEVRFAVPYVTDEPRELEIVEADGAGGCRRSVTRTVADAFEAELVAFHAMVTTGRAPSSGPWDGLADLVVAQRIIRALARSMGVTVMGEAAEPLSPLLELTSGCIPLP